MNIAELELKWQTALRKYFPGVIVREDRSIPEEDILPFLGVYMIPDDRMLEYIRFSLNERPEFIQREKLPDCDLLPCSVSNTRVHYPSLWKQAQQESVRFGVTQKVKPAKAQKKTLAKKPARRAQPAAR